MRTIVHRLFAGIIAVAVGLTVLLAGSGTASAVEPCRLNMVWAGPAGEIYASLAPNGFVQFQDYQPHGSVNPKDLRSGQILKFLVQHIDTRGNKTVGRADAECLIP